MRDDAMTHFLSKIHNLHLFTWRQEMSQVAVWALNYHLVSNRAEGSQQIQSRGQVINSLR